MARLLTETKSFDNNIDFSYLTSDSSITVTFICAEDKEVFNIEMETSLIDSNNASLSCNTNNNKLKYIF